MPAVPSGPRPPAVHCGHKIGPEDVVVRVEGRPKDFLICQNCWRPAQSYAVGSALVTRLYGTGATTHPAAVGPTPCAGCGHPVIRGANARMHYVTCSRACTVRASKLRNGLLRPPVSKPCAACAQPVIGRADQQYCTPACRQRAYRSRIKDDAPS